MVTADVFSYANMNATMKVQPCAHRPLSTTAGAIHVLELHGIDCSRLDDVSHPLVPLAIRGGFAWFDRSDTSQLDGRRALQGAPNCVSERIESAKTDGDVLECFGPVVIERPLESGPVGVLADFKDTS